MKSTSYKLMESVSATAGGSTAQTIFQLREGFVNPYFAYLSRLDEGVNVSRGDIEKLFSQIKSNASVTKTSNLTLVGRLISKVIPQQYIDKFFKSLPSPKQSRKVLKYARLIKKLVDSAPEKAKPGIEQIAKVGEEKPQLQGYLLGALTVVVQVLAKIAGTYGVSMGIPPQLTGAVVGAIGGGLIAMIAAKVSGKSYGEAFKQGIKGALSGAAAGALGGLIGELLSVADAVVPPTDANVGSIGDAGGVADTASSVTSAPEPTTSEYTVKSGDTLSNIAQKNGISVQELIAANPDLQGANPNDLAAGAKIDIPEKTGSATYAGGVGTASDTGAKVASGQLPPSKYGIKESFTSPIDVGATAFTYRIAESVGKQRPRSVQLTNEGIGDMFAKAGSWLKTKAQNVTQAVTIDKLTSAWNKAGSPTDSDKIADVMVAAKIPQQAVIDAFKATGLPEPKFSSGERIEPNGDDEPDDQSQTTTQTQATLAPNTAQPSKVVSDLKTLETELSSRQPTQDEIEMITRLAGIVKNKPSQMNLDLNNPNETPDNSMQQNLDFSKDVNAVDTNKMKQQGFDFGDAAEAPQQTSDEYEPSAIAPVRNAPRPPQKVANRAFNEPSGTPRAKPSAIRSGIRPVKRK